MTLSRTRTDWESASLANRALEPAIEIHGAGATFSAALYKAWADSYRRDTGVAITYASVGSGAGIRHMDAHAADFGASDAPQALEVLRRKGQIQFPTAIGGVVPICNLKDVLPGQITLSGPVLADIYLGKITKWDASAIKRLNPTIDLPDSDIRPVHRADGSGTTYIFTRFLSNAHEIWRRQIAHGLSVNWYCGIGVKGNDGMAAFVSRMPNSIGYVEYSHVKSGSLCHANMLHTSGEVVSPGAWTFGPAFHAGGAVRPSLIELETILVKSNWPMMGATCAILANQAGPHNSVPGSPHHFFDWTFRNGDDQALALGFTPLPSRFKHLARQLW